MSFCWKPIPPISELPAHPGPRHTSKPPAKRNRTNSQTREESYPRRVSGTEMINPDFTTLARAYGFHGERVARTEEFADAFSRALASPTGAVLDLNVASEAITPAMTIKDLQALSEH